ncbi:MAG: PRC-barrel domain-containing protein [Anaerolineales bacterium]|nr:PRC-barrel domain-containing protein [Anaerolineales bacterium]
MLFKQFARVRTAEGHEVGHLGRVVVRPDTREITHLVIHQGLLFTEDKVVPLEFVDQATEAQIVLSRAAGDLKTLPPFEERQDIFDDAAPPDRTLAELAGRPATYPAAPGPRLLTRLERNLPVDTVALKGSAKIVTADGRYAGALESVAAAPDTRQITHLEIASGLLAREYRLIPIAWVVILGEDEIHLSVDRKTLTAIRPHLN